MISNPGSTSNCVNSLNRILQSTWLRLMMNERMSTRRGEVEEGEGEGEEGEGEGEGEESERGCV